MKKEESKKKWGFESEIRFAKEVQVIEYDMEMGHNGEKYAARRAAGIPD